MPATGCVAGLDPSFPKAGDLVRRVWQELLCPLVQAQTSAVQKLAEHVVTCSSEVGFPFESQAGGQAFWRALRALPRTARASPGGAARDTTGRAETTREGGACMVLLASRPEHCFGPEPPKRRSLRTQISFHGTAPRPQLSKQIQSSSWPRRYRGDRAIDILVGVANVPNVVVNDRRIVIGHVVVIRDPGDVGDVRVGDVDLLKVVAADVVGRNVGFTPS